MSTKEDFGFEKLNRVPKGIIQEAVAEYRAKNPGTALNRMDLCFIVSENLEKSYLKTELEANTETDDNENKKKKNYNGQHILKKMGLDTTKKILRKIDFYIYKYYSTKK